MADEKLVLWAAALEKELKSLNSDSNICAKAQI